MTDAPTSPEPPPLRFAVVDDEDLAVMSAHLQDALLNVSDAAYLPTSRRFASVVSRVDWHGIAAGRPERRQAGFHFERVMRVQRSGFEPSGETVPLQLLAVSFAPSEVPAGAVILTFAGHKMIRLDVECLEAEMRDLGPGWPADDCPRRHLDGSETAR